jgi:gluconolactonase
MKCIHRGEGNEGNIGLNNDTTGGWVMALVVLVIIAGCARREEPRKVGKLEAVDDRFWDVIPKDSYLERIGIAFEFTEGPAWHTSGHLIFSDIPASKIYRWTGRKYEVFRDSSHQSNGLLVEPGGALLACEHGSRSVARYTPEGSRQVMADQYQGRRLNSPNDLCRSTTGTIYFTDPPWGLPQLNEDPDKELPFNGVYMLKNGRLSLIDSTLSWPNGIALSPDESALYVANVEITGEPGPEAGEVDAFWVRYRLNEGGTPVGRDVFYRAEDTTLPGGPDGMEVDRAGNLFVTGPGGILVLSPDGTLLGTIEVPMIPSNMTFGPREQELYITARTNLYRLVFK